jgi:FdhD protein
MDFRIHNLLRRAIQSLHSETLDPLMKSHEFDRIPGAPAETGRASMEVMIDKVTGHSSRHIQDTLAVEEPLEIQLAYGSQDARSVKSISVTMRTPGHDFDLAAGFLMTEGVVRDANDIEQIVYAAGSIGETTQENNATQSALPYQPGKNVVRVELTPDVAVSLANLERNFYTTSSCGICGKASLLALQTACPPRRKNTFQIEADVLTRLPHRLREAQSLFNQTGGIHGAGLSNSNGELLGVKEDVGRHNAVDKLLGAEFLADRTPLRHALLFLSGRASFELLQKALMGGVSMVTCVGAPSSLAVQVAKDFDIILVGFLRDNHFNIYHGTEHILGHTSDQTQSSIQK